MLYTAISTAQNVKISYNIASLGHRILAVLIDLIIIFIYMVVLAYMDMGLGSIMPEDGRIGLRQLSYLPVMTYSLIFHLLFNGRTPGKFIMSIKVVKRDGAPASWSDYIIRWILRLIDIWTTTGAVGLISIIFTDQNQRLGDAAADTIVIDTRKKTRVSHTILEEVESTYTPTFNMVTLLSDNQVNEIKEIYRLAGDSKDYETLKVLRDKIEQILKIQSDLRDAVFVRTILKDYTHLTQGL
ncbi:hypothetical protein BST97_00915 [Nonlabens spongiae]|uniref:RDD domain-containing protein n=1 Tax=Nonlabens spongiae TaxID=331648 RepID=A0A1W6MGF4_9FLAO|nr:RDD family protein [Nonlabens spongiae]ARN76678.1 hypothetical protein BST97_00915 [Nonlabens spongiae]